MFRLLLKEYTNGNKYLCKSESDAWMSYKGSGNNVRNNDNLILEQTTLLGEFETNAELKEVGIYYSDLWDVVNSEDFLNQTREEGQGGNTNSYSPERNKKISEKLKNKPKTEEHKRKISAAVKGFVTAWDTVTEKVVKVNQETFDTNERYVGIAAVKAKNIPKSEDWKEKRRGHEVSEETREKLRGPNPKKANKGSKNGNSRTIIVMGTKYDTVTEACKALNTNANWLRRRLISDKYLDYYYCKEK